MTAKLSRLRRRLHLQTAEHDELLSDLLDDAEMFMLSYTGRDFLPEALLGAQTEIAAASYHLLGLEGAGSHSEGEISATIDRLPPALRAMLDQHRIARVG